ncbi:hypothetical protein ACFX12_004032 [Malus domestica]
MNSTHLHSIPNHNSHVHESDTEQVPEATPEQVLGSTCYPLRPQGKKASKRRGSFSKNDYAKYMEELARQGELTLARKMAKFEVDKAKAPAVERLFQANERERKLLRQEREIHKEERRAQQDCDIMNTPVDAMHPNSKYFWNSKKADVVRMRRTRDEGASGDGPSTTNWLGDDFSFTRKVLKNARRLGGI